MNKRANNERRQCNFLFQILEIHRQFPLRSTFVVCDDGTQSVVREALSGISGTVHLLSFGSVDGCSNDLEALVTQANETVAPKPAVVVTQDKAGPDVCAQIFWSSGTTGKPKGIRHSHQSIWNIFTTFSVTPSNNNLTTLHFFHIGGCFHVLSDLIKGSTCTYVRSSL